MPFAEYEPGETLSESPERSKILPTGGVGCFITFEGIEGSGKTTQIRRLADRIERTGREVVSTLEPGGTAVGRLLRTALLGEFETDLTPVAELMLYAADRAQHLVEVIEPALERGAVVLCDRYLDASLAYQGYGRELGCEMVLSLHRMPPLTRRPHRTVLLDIEPEVSVGRARRRNQELGTYFNEGRFDGEDMAFHGRVRDGYLLLAGQEPERFRVVDADGTMSMVESRIWEEIRDLVEAVH